MVKSENYEHVYTVGAKREILIFGLVTFFGSVNTSGDWQKEWLCILQVFESNNDSDIMEVCHIPEWGYRKTAREYFFL